MVGKTKHITPGEYDRIAAAAKKANRGMLTKQVVVSLLYKHGLRVSELCTMRLSDLKLEEGTLFVRRFKGSHSGLHPVYGSELRLLRRYIREVREHNKGKHLDYLVLNERGTEYSRAGIQKIVKQLGEDAGLMKSVNPHSFRHGCGYKLVNEMKDVRWIAAYLGHANINNTMVYTSVNAQLFKDFFD